MPLPTDQHVVETSKGLVETLHGIFGPHPGFRPAHAKGLLLKGTFTPTETAKSLSTAQHFTTPSTPVIVRFSSSTGIPNLPDTDPNGNPRGIAIRFRLAETPRRVHTDIVAHSVDGFPGSNGDEALAFFRSLADGSIGAFLATHPKAAAFVQTPKPFPESFATERFFGVNAIKLVGADGRGTFVRYRVEPAAGFRTLSDEEVKARSANYLFDEVPARLAAGGTIVFRLTAQVAEEGDVTDDACAHWPEERKVVELGTVTLDGLLEDGAAEQQHIIFDPVPRVPGLEPSADPLLDVRAGVYLISGKERRAAPPTAA
ncbi:Catalase-like domain-containing protein [Pleurostoma richardsiae]|uniref:Catalase-like domain-containing protein n=1 Tax=Pleurostoma richardsiae TaxID=41990 RepID=A0AA38RN50_9PEZI|nr:Catalase-like domain-containing protein [Pleurostoma richardsiae]